MSAATTTPDHRLSSRHVASFASSSSSAPHPSVTAASSSSSSQDSSNGSNYNDHPASSLGHIRHRSITTTNNNSSSYIASSTSGSTDNLNDSYKDYDDDDEDGVKDDRYNNSSTNLKNRNVSNGSHTSSLSSSSSSMAPYPPQPISPRSGNYERLENGQGPNRSNPFGSRVRIVGWRRSLLVGVFVVVGLWFFFGKETTGEGGAVGFGSWIPGDGSRYPDGGYGIMPVGDHKAGVNLDPPPEPIAFEKSGSSSNKGNSNNNKVIPPTSPETDPDPSKTVYCTSPYTPGARLVQYALMIDAGSTGSRIHIYKFNNCGASPEYEYEIFRQKKPGLSSFKDDPTSAAESLDELLDAAVSNVPKELQACTPVAVKATAGLRLLGARQSKAILSAVRKRLQDRYPFPLYEGADGGAVVIMDGKEEGVYAWITANYLLHTIRADTPKGAPAYAVLDLGGASTQIVFEPTFEEADGGKLGEGEHKYDLQFGGRKHVLYQHSYLGYGLMRARKSVHMLVDFMATLRPSYKFNTPAGGIGDDEDGSGKRREKIANPCLARGTERLVTIEDELTATEREVIMAGEHVGSFEACNRVVELVMAKDAVCEVKPCSFNGVYQPSLLDTFPNGKILLLSYFFDRIDPLLPKDTNAAPPLTISTIAELASDICEGQATWERRWGTDRTLMEELEGRPEYCLDLTFMHALLRLGYEFADDREVMIGKQIEGTELGWALGATLAMVGGELTCRV